MDVYQAACLTLQKLKTRGTMVGFTQLFLGRRTRGGYLPLARGGPLRPVHAVTTH